MLFRDRTEKKIMNLERLVDIAEPGVGEGAVDPRISRRVEGLKRLRSREKEDLQQERTIRLPDQKSATSLSLLFPGLGQIYMKQKAIGLSFALSNILLVAFYLFLSGILSMPALDSRLAPSYDFHMLIIVPLAIAILSGISIHMAFGLFPELKLARLITANRKNNLYWVSLIFPGYGQLLNGQPKKAIVFSSLGILGIFSIVSLAFTYSINWYEYTKELGMHYVEKWMLVMAGVLLLSLASYIVSVFDAFVVKRHPYLKRPPLARLKRFLGIKRNPKDKTPYRRTSFKFVAVSMLLIFFAGFYLLRSPELEFYKGQKSTIERVFREKGMTLIPNFISKAGIPSLP